MTVETAFLAYWRALNAWRADLGLRPFTLGELRAWLADPC